MTRSSCKNLHIEDRYKITLIPPLKRQLCSNLTKPNALHISSTPSRALEYKPKEDEAKRNKTAHDDAVPPLLGRYPANQGIDAGHLAGGARDPALNIGERLALDAEAVVDGVRLAQDAVRHGVAVVDAVALVEHVLGLGGLGVVGAVLVNVGADIGQEVGAVACLAERRAQPRQVPLVRGELVAEEGEVVLLESRRREGCLGVEEPGELLDRGIALPEAEVSLGGYERCLMLAVAWACLSGERAVGRRRTFSNSSSILVSVVASSSVGLGEMLAADENCE